MRRRSLLRSWARAILVPACGLALRATPASPASQAFIEKYCADCHDDSDDNESGLDLTSLEYKPEDSANFLSWIKVHDRLDAGEMPPKKRARPDKPAMEAFLADLDQSLSSADAAIVQSQGRAGDRRLNAYEYENALQDLLQAPWLQIKGQLPEDGEVHRFNKTGEALDVSHVHMSRFMLAADYAIKQAMSVEWSRPPTTVTRYYARDQRTLTSKFTQNPFNSSPDRQTYPVLGLTPQHDVRVGDAPLSVGDKDPAKRELEAVGWVSSNYVTGFTYRWDGFKAPVAGRYRVRFSGYTLWVGPGGVSRHFTNDRDRVGKEGRPQNNLPDYDKIYPGRGDEPITVYTRNGVENRRLGGFDLTPEPEVHDLGTVWLLGNETLVPDASRFYRSRPNNFHNPLMQKDGAPSVAFRWMEVEGPLYDESTTAGYRLLFGDLPLRKAQNPDQGIPVPAVTKGEHRSRGRKAGSEIDPVQEPSLEVVSEHPKEDAERLLRGFLAKAYRRPASEADLQLFVGLVQDRMDAGLSFTQAMLAGYTAVLVSPRFLFIEAPPGRLDDYALATRLSLFLWNSTPDAELRSLADRHLLHDPNILDGQVERMLNDPKVERFIDAFLDYWVDLRKMEDTTPSATLYNDYYLDDSLTEAAQLETRMFFGDLLRHDLPAKNIIDSNYAFLNERLANHYGISGVKGIEMRKVALPPDCARGGLMTQASVLKVTANGTTTSPVLRGKWILERILGQEIPPPPPVPAVEPDIRGAVTIRQQLEKHRQDKSCAVCHSKMDPPGFALESFDVLGAWRDRYRGSAEDKTPEKGIGKNGQPFAFYYALPVDSTGQLPDGRTFTGIRDFKKLLLSNESQIARNMAQQFIIFATGVPPRYSDRPAIERILNETKPDDYGIRSLIHAVVRSDLFLNK